MTPYLTYRKADLHLEGVSLAVLAARFGTPLYVYSRSELIDRYQGLKEADAKDRAIVCYSVKANSNLAILRTFRELGAGFDVTSAGELFLALKTAQTEAGGARCPLVFSGAGKTRSEIEFALRNDILMINAESEAELDVIEQTAAAIGRRAPISFRVNPNVDPKTHPYIATGLKKHKFGVPWKRALPLYRKAQGMPHVQVVGISCHIGSQMVTLAPVQDALRRVLDLVHELGKGGIRIQYVDAGGGLGIRYRKEAPPSPALYIQTLLQGLISKDLKLIVEPGRSLVGNSGVLLTRALYRKENEGKRFVIVDAAMTDLIRPTLYDAHHEILPVRKQARGTEKVDVVGPVCESGDFIARDRRLPRVEANDLLAVLSAGAYGYAMSSNYNGRLRPAEVMVEEDRVEIIRPRQTFEALL
ncbi:MAG: diaminopimelate decarboxylase [Nitrospirae bacterium]|nr:diaminopimelate decarboxylase [Nitrospirota bacterium]